MCSLVVDLVANQAVKMCITPSAPQGPCIFMGLPLTSMLRLSCGLSEQTIQLGEGTASLCGVCLPHVMCVCVCVCLCGCNYAPVCVCVFVCACM